MPHKTASRVLETSVTSGTGTLSLGGAATGRQTFIAGIGNGNRTTYTVYDPVTGAWERGIGTVTSGTPNLLSRDLVLESTNAGALVVFAANTKDVFVDFDPNMMSGAYMDAVAKTATFTLTPPDNGTVFDMSPAAATTVNLPALASVWLGWSATFTMETATAAVTIDGNGSEVIDADLTYRLDKVGQSVTIVKASATKWKAINIAKGVNVVRFTSGAVADPSGFNAVAGTYTPAPGVKRIRVKVQAPGGGGGSGNTVDGSCGGGGGGGGYAEKLIERAGIGASVTVTVGAQGTSTTTTSGTTGGTTSFAASSGTVSATGGTGGTMGTTSTGVFQAGSGGVGSGGDINVTGGGGLPGSGAAGYGGMGGSAVLGGGGRGSTTSGTAGGDFGAGGSGAQRSPTTVNQAGGSGGNAIVIVEEYFS